MCVGTVFCYNGEPSPMLQRDGSFVIKIPVYRGFKQVIPLEMLKPPKSGAMFLDMQHDMYMLKSSPWKPIVNITIENHYHKPVDKVINIERPKNE